MGYDDLSQLCQFRATEREKRWLRQTAEKRAQSMSDFIRCCIFPFYQRSIVGAALRGKMADVSPETMLRLLTQADNEGGGLSREDLKAVIKWVNARATGVE